MIGEGRPRGRSARRQADHPQGQEDQLDRDEAHVHPAEQFLLPSLEAEEQHERRPGGQPGHEEQRAQNGRVPERTGCHGPQEHAGVDAQRDPHDDVETGECRHVSAHPRVEPAEAGNPRQSGQPPVPRCRAGVEAQASRIDTG